jgi:tetratricopeptide (TPR) repeat protein
VDPEFEEAFALDKAIKDAFKNRDFERVVSLCTNGLSARFIIGDMHKQRARAYMEMGRYEDALADLNITLKGHADSVELYRMRGFTLAQLERYDDSFADLSSCIRLAKVPVAMAFYCERAAIRSVASLAREDPRAAADRNDELPALKDALPSFTRGKYSDVAEQMGAILERNPSSWRALGLRGLSFAALGTFAQAEADLATAAQNAPSRGFLWHELGIVLEQSGKWREAIRAFDGAISREGEDVAEYVFDRARAHFRAGDLAEALGGVRQSIAADAGLPRAHYLLGLALAERGDFRSALTELQLAVKLQPRLNHAYAARAWIHALMKEWDRAAEQVDRLHSNAWRMLMLGWIRFHRGRTEEARRAFRYVGHFAPRGSPLAVLARRCMHDPGSITVKDFRAIWWSR